MMDYYLPQQWELEKISKQVYPSRFAFFRDDDVGLRNDKFLELAERFVKSKTPLNLAIIPSKINCIGPNIKHYLSKEFALLQHGFKHQNNAYNRENDKNIKGEFYFSIDHRLADSYLKQGWEIFNFEFLPRFKGFIPPWHTFPDVNLLIDNQYQVISGYGNKVEVIKDLLISVPTNLDIISNYEESICYGERELSNRIDRLLEESGFVGILLHHNYIKKEELGLLDQLIESLKAKSIPIISLEEAIKWI